MTREEVLKKWNELNNAYTEKQAKLQEELQRWLYSDDSDLIDKRMEHSTDTIVQQIEETKAAADQLWEAYERIVEEEKLRGQSLMEEKSSGMHM